jgi:hypothetical protein
VLFENLAFTCEKDFMWLLCKTFLKMIPGLKSILEIIFEHFKSDTHHDMIEIIHLIYLLKTMP